MSGDTHDDGAAVPGSGDAAPGGGPAGDAAEEVPAPAEPPAFGGRIAARREAAQAAARSAPTPAPAHLQAAEQQRAEQARVQYEPLWPLVTQVLGLIQHEDDLQALTARFELTRNFAQDLGQRNALEQALLPRLAQVPQLATVSRQDITAIINLAYDELLGISVLGPYWRDDEVVEILVDGWDSITVERDGVLVRTGARFRDVEHARSVARILAAKVSDRSLTQKTPLVDAELPGARVAFAIDKVVRSGIAVAIRKARPLLDINGLLAVGAMDAEVRDFLADCVRARANIVVSGGTTSGKTTVINALSAFIPDTERVITIEDTYELVLTNTHRLHLQTKAKASSDDKVAVTLADLLVMTLRMRPDRVIVGEIREGQGAVVMMDAANTGHDGTMTTIHANSADRAMNFRLVQLLRRGADMSDDVAKNEVASAVDLVVQVVKRNGRRFVSEVAVVDPSYMRDGHLQIAPVFAGTVVAGDDGVANTRFSRVGHVGAETDLAMKLIDQGSADRWVERVEEA